MKRILSVLLCVCLILGLLVFPINAEEETKLLYKFDFSGNSSDYSKEVKDHDINGIDYNFSTINYGENSNAKAVVDYVTFGGKKALRVRANGAKSNVAVTPLKADGSPIVLEAGKTYTVKATIIPIRSFLTDYHRFLTEAYVRNDGKSNDYINTTNYASVAADKHYVPGAIQHRSAAVYTDGVKAYYMLCDSSKTTLPLASHAA